MKIWSILEQNLLFLIFTKFYILIRVNQGGGKKETKSSADIGWRNKYGNAKFKEEEDKHSFD